MKVNVEDSRANTFMKAEDAKLTAQDTPTSDS